MVKKIYFLYLYLFPNIQKVFYGVMVYSTPICSRSRRLNVIIFIRQLERNICIWRILRGERTRKLSKCPRAIFNFRSTRHNSLAQICKTNAPPPPRKTPESLKHCIAGVRFLTRFAMYETFSSFASIQFLKGYAKCLISFPTQRETIF